ncbi:MAG: DUF4340 domain-containing protein [Eubacteriales bacterium]|nr:DUF4340 domain-containing protein [Eubacteriales bacterium]
MRKQKIQFIILAVICIVCIGGYFGLKNAEFSQDEETTETTVTGFSKDDATELTVTGDHELHFVKENDVWTEQSLPGENITQSSINYLLTLIDNITTSETVIEAPDNLSEYGLEEPYRTISATLSDGSVITIYAGNESSLLSKYYIRVEGDDNVYLVSSYIVTEFDKTAEEFVEEETETNTEEAVSEETEPEEPETAAKAEETAEE